VKRVFPVAALQKHEQILSRIFTTIRQNFPSDSTLILGRQRSTFSGFDMCNIIFPNTGCILLTSKLMSAEKSGMPSALGKEKRF
jgi:hypothetical protein